MKRLHSCVVQDVLLFSGDTELCGELYETSAELRNMLL